MLQNVTLLAIVAIHTAANEPPKVRQVMNKIHRNVAAASAALKLPAAALAAQAAHAAQPAAQPAAERTASFARSTPPRAPPREPTLR